MSKEKVNWDLLKEQNWHQISKDMLEYESRFGDKGTNKEKLLFMICKLTGIEFKDIKISAELGRDCDYQMTLYTDNVRPDIGICGKYIYKFFFSLHYRTPITHDDGRIILSFCPSLGFKLMSGGTNGFDTGGWIYYDVKDKEWVLK